MATQGMVTVIADGKVAIKIIAGCDGDQGYELVKLIHQHEGKLNASTAQALAERAGLGCEECLVVLEMVNSPGASGVVSNRKHLHERYLRTFDDPRFNPRWERGTCPHVWIVGKEHGTTE